MSLLPIVEYPDSGLRRSSVAVTEFDRKLPGYASPRARSG